MYSVSSAFNTEILKPSRTFECRVTVGTYIFTNDDVVSIEFDGDLQANSSYTIGNVISQNCDIVFRNNGNVVIDSNVITVEIGLLVNGAFEYVQMGIFNVDDYKQNDFTITVKCFDNMIKFESDFTASISGTTTNTVTLLNAVLTQIGIDKEGSILSIPITVPQKTYTCRQILGYIASVLGKNAVINRYGKVKFVGLNSSGIGITSSNYFKFTLDKNQFVIKKLICTTNDTELSLGSTADTTMEIKVENPLMTNEGMSNAYSIISTIAFMGYSSSTQGNPALDLGDIITIIDTKGVSRNVPILSQKLKYNGGITSDIGAKGENKIANSYKTYSGQYYTNKNFEMDLGNLQNNFSALNTNFNTLNTNYTNLNTDVTSLKNSNTQMQKQLSDSQKDMIMSDGLKNPNILRNGDFNDYIPSGGTPTLYDSTTSDWADRGSIGIQPSYIPWWWYTKEWVQNGLGGGYRSSGYHSISGGPSGGPYITLGRGNVYGSSFPQEPNLIIKDRYLKIPSSATYIIFSGWARVSPQNSTNTTPDSTEGKFAICLYYKKDKTLGSSTDNVGIVGTWYKRSSFSSTSTGWSSANGLGLFLNTQWIEIPIFFDITSLTSNQKATLWFEFYNESESSSSNSDNIDIANFFVSTSSLGFGGVNTTETAGGNYSYVPNTDDINNRNDYKYDGKYVAQVSGKSLVDNTQITKLSGVSENATKTESSATNGNIKINGTETTVYIHPGTGTNPHGTTKVDIGLGNTDNTSDVNKPVSTATQTALNGKVNNSQVLTNVPVGAVFTDTVTTINNKTGAIAKADIVALGIPAQDTTYSNVTQSTSGLMSNTDKTKLDGITANASNVTSSITNGNIKVNGTETTVYTHPTNHAPSIITQDSNNRFVTDTQISTWNNKFDKTGGSVTGNIEVDTSYLPQLRAKNTATNNTIMVVPSSTVGEYIFGGNTDGGTIASTYLRVGQNKLQYGYGVNGFDIYHTGNKPTATDVGALPITGGTITGNFYANRIIGEQKFTLGADDYTDPLVGTPCAIKVTGKIASTEDHYVNGNKVYHEGNKPTLSDIGITTPTIYNPTLQNSWSNFGTPFSSASYYKTIENIVNLTGTIHNGTVTDGTIIFTLPSGYYPSTDKDFLVIYCTNSGTFAWARINISSSGNVKLYNASNVYWLSLDNISFLAV